MSRRKPALRIGGGGVVNRHTFSEEDASSKKGGLGLLGAYGDSDTDDIAGHRAEQSQDTSHKAATTLDSKVADFLKEIDELETDSKPSEATETEPPQISWGDWTQCMDEKTQHPYYWNTTTNEVTWTLPEEISVQLKRIQQYSSTAEKKKIDEEKATQDNQNSQNAKATEPAPKSILKSSSASETKSNDIDVDKELENALHPNPDEQSRSVSDTDLELELLRAGTLPLSNAEEEDMLERFEPEVLKLEEEEEKRRAAGTWTSYKDEIEKKKKIIMADKMKWRAERMVVLLKMRPKDEKENSPGGMFDSNEDEGKDDKSNDMVLSPVATTAIDEGKCQVTKQFESTKRFAGGKSLQNGDSGVRNETSNSVGVQCCLSEEPTRDNGNTEMKSQITELSDVISGKLSYLEVSRRAMTDFHALLIEMETRMKDWREKALSDLYVKERLHEAAQKLKSYEESATPAGWSCHWDSAAKRYFYKNKDNGQLQWQYPIVQNKIADKAKEDSSIHDTEKKTKRKVELLKDSEDRAKRSRSESPVRSAREILVTKTESNAVTANTDNSSSVSNQVSETSTAHTSMTYMNAGQYSYAGYHGQGYMSYNPYQQYTQQMQSMFSAPDSMPPPPGEESANFLGGNPPPLPSEQPPPLPSPPSDPAAEGETGADDDGIVMEMSEGEVSDEDSNSTENKAGVMSQNAIIYKPPEVAQYTNQAATTGAPFSAMAMYTSQSNVSAVGEQHATMAKPGAVKATKMKKVKKTKKSAAAKKPPKEMTSLVAQWQKAKHQMEEETRRLEEDDEEDEDQAQIAKKQIEKWKKDQIQSGKALMNANFEPIPDDWRSRVLKKKSKS